MEKQPSSFQPVIGSSQLVAPAKEDPELHVDKRNSHHLELADMALSRMKRNRTTKCQSIEAGWPKDRNLFVSLLRAADQKPASLLLRNLLNPSLLAAFRK